jgi:hypothetical protein
MKSDNLQSKGNKLLKWIRETHPFGAYEFKVDQLKLDAEAVLNDSTLPASIREMADSVLFLLGEAEDSQLTGNPKELINSGIRAGLVFAEMYHAMGLHAPGPGDSPQWEKAGELFKKLQQEGRQMLPKQFWKLCLQQKIFSENYTLETFRRNYGRKKKMWLEGAGNGPLPSRTGAVTVHAI